MFLPVWTRERYYLVGRSVGKFPLFELVRSASTDRTNKHFVVVYCIFDDDEDDDDDDDDDDPHGIKHKAWQPSPPSPLSLCDHCHHIVCNRIP